jgi:hypothetical protein
MQQQEAKDHERIRSLIILSVYRVLLVSQDQGGRDVVLCTGKIRTKF